MIKRAEHIDGFTVIQNEALRDTRLSIEARGFLAFLLTMTDGWDFSIKGLATQANIPERSVMRLAKELKAAGYLDQVNVRSEQGSFAGREWVIYETPALRETRSAVNPQCGKTEVRQTRSAASPQCGFRAPIRNTISKEIPNRKKDHKESKAPSKRFTPPTLEEVAAYCQERGNNVNPEHFISYYESNGWKVGRNAMKDWKAAVRTWEQRDKTQAKPEPIRQAPGDESRLQRLTRLALERAEGGSK